MSDLVDSLRKAQRLPFGFVARANDIPFAGWIFPINPEAYTINYPTKGNVTQTLGGNWEDWFGMGIPTADIRGTFGFRPRSISQTFGNPGGLLPGQAQFKFVESMFKSFYSFTNENARNADIEMNFFSLSDGHFFRVRIQTFQFERSINHQFLYRYDIRLLVLEDFLAPTGFVGQMTIGALPALMAGGTAAISDLGSAIKEIL